MMKCEHEGKSRILKNIYERNNDYSRDSLKIYQCENCGAIYKQRYQYDSGTGNDFFIIMPGEEIRGYNFTYKELADVISKDTLAFFDTFFRFGDMKINDLKIQIENLNSLRHFTKMILKLIVKSDSGE